MSSTLSRVEGAARAFARTGWRAAFDDYLELTKPRIIELLLITTLAAMIMAARGIPPLALTFWTLVGGALAAASARAFNCVYDSDIDTKMQRTMGRRCRWCDYAQPRALAFAMVLGAGSFLLLNYLVNPLAAWLSLGGNAYYVFVYDVAQEKAQHLAEHRHRRVRGLDSAARRLGRRHRNARCAGARARGVDLLWTPPHFWALALMTETDYHKAGIPMLPNVHGVARTKREDARLRSSCSSFASRSCRCVFRTDLLAAALIVGGWFLFGGARPAQRRAVVRARDVQIFARLSRADVPRRRHRSRGFPVTA